MKTIAFLSTLVVMSLLAASTRALDAVRTTKASLTGTIEKITPQEVSIRRSGNRVETVAVNEIISIRFDGEPPLLNSVRSQVRNGSYTGALATLERLKEEGKGLDGSRVTEEIEFYEIYATARLALGGGEDVREAGRRMAKFVSGHPQSHHFYQANETVGDLLVAVGLFDNALPYYDQLERAPWVDYKMRARAAKGRALRAQKKPKDAMQIFEAAITLAGDQDDPLILAQRQVSVLGKAACLADLERYDEAVTVVEGVIAAADPENAALHARSYNTLGTCLRKKGSHKEALLAFLHVDVLYFSEPEAHAEALKNLADLWLQANQPDRALAARQLLNERYKNSPWAKSN